MLATVLGNPIRRILVRGTILEALVPSVTTKLLVSFFSGVSFISLLFLTAGIIPGAIGSLTLWGLLGAGVAVNAILYRSSIFRIRTSLKMLKSRLGPKDHWFIVLFVGVFVFQMTPLLGLWVTPGDDGNLYSLITQRFVESNGIPNDPAWLVLRTDAPPHPRILGKRGRPCISLWFPRRSHGFRSGKSVPGSDSA